VTADIITVLAVVAGIIWLGLMLVSALRNRGGSEEVSPNLKPGIDDQQLETRRLEGGQKAAIAFSAFLAISLPLYFLGENSRQEGFVEEFSEASITRGEHLAEEFGCFDCHGPLGSGGSANYVEPRSGVTVTWAAPSLDDVLYRFDSDEVNYWITFGRANTPMPAWGLAGGGPMNENQVEDLVNYLTTIQIPQQQVVDETVGIVEAETARLAGADATVQSTVTTQQQVVAEIDQAPADFEVIGPLSEQAAEVLVTAGDGIDTDDDGLSDSSELQLSAISSEAVAHFVLFEPVVLDPEVADAELAEEGLATLGEGVATDPILQVYVDRVTTALEGDEISDESPDTDSDGISDAGESAITGLFAEASVATVPSDLLEIDLDPANPESVDGVTDRATATGMVGGLETVGINLRVTVENEDRIRTQQEAGLDFLLQAQQDQRWAVDVAGVAESMEGSEDEAQRAVALFNGYCARCHTAGYSAGVPFTLESGSGGFGPALWDGRPTVQFGEAPEDPDEPDLLVDFITTGSESETAYGLNGFGSGRMPGFGAILDAADIDLLARYLRGGNLDGVEE
jgi:mono/diheme cytochrome c family protein